MRQVVDPSLSEVDKLPRLVRIALAARCARRVQPLFSVTSSEVSEKQLRALDQAIASAEAVAGGKGADWDFDLDNSVRQLLAIRNGGATDISQDIARCAYATYAAAHISDRMATEAIELALLIVAKTHENIDKINVATGAVVGSIAGMLPGGPVGAAIGMVVGKLIGRSENRMMAMAIQKDFVFASKSRRQLQLTDASPVSVAEFGPLWPMGEPGWFKQQRASHEHGQKTLRPPQARVTTGLNSANSAVSELLEDVLLERPPDRDTRIAAQITALLERPMASDFDSVYTEIKSLGELAKQEMAERLAPAFNQKLASMPHATYEAKKELCKWANEQLRQVGLAIRCPKTGRPAILVAGKDPRPEEGRFRLQTSFEDGSNRITVSHISLWPFELMPEPPRNEAFLLHQDRIVASKGKSHSREK